MAATMPGPRAAFGIMLDPHGKGGDDRQHGRTAQVRVRVAAYTNGTSVGTSGASWDMQQAAKSIACGTQASSCFRGGCPLSGSPRRVLLHAAALCRKAQGAMCVDERFDTHGAAGAVKRPAFRTSLRGNGRQEDQE